MLNVVCSIVWSFLAVTLASNGGEISTFGCTSYPVATYGDVEVTLTVCAIHFLPQSIRYSTNILYNILNYSEL